MLCQPMKYLYHLTESARRPHLAVLVLLLVHVGLLVWSSVRHTPSNDEVAHMTAGLSHYRLGRFDLYRVNPPLVRLLATLPVALSRPVTDWSSYYASDRPEWTTGRIFIEANGQNALWYFKIARWACIPLSVVGGLVCYHWGRELYGTSAGLLALTLWCFSPNVIAHAQMITPDAGAAALGLAAAYTFWRWLKLPNWPRTLVAGLVLGLAELAKTTCIVLLLLWPLLWFVWCFAERRDLSRQEWWRRAARLCTILLLALCVINLAYGFQGSCRKLGSYRFVSRTLTGRTNPIESLYDAANRFAGTWQGNLPVPLPADYVLGIDYQKRDFERTKWSYLGGEWRKGGWWYYYLYALAVKVPLGTMALLLLTILVSLGRRGYTTGWRDELLLLVPPAGVLLLVSSQTGFSHHLRYVLPIFPFAFVWTSKIARAARLRHHITVALAAVAVLWSAASSLWVYPHSLSYFNELVGGPTGGHAHLITSNIDWGQDLLYLKSWSDEHPQARPLHLAVSSLFDLKILGIEHVVLAPGRNFPRAARTSSNDTWSPKPGWYAISVDWLRSRTQAYACFLRLKPVARAGYSIYIYHITPGEANRVRKDMGLGESCAFEPRRARTTTVNHPAS